MNKTKNDKYLRKNRHDKNSKHKHKNKTRKVQRGGKVDPVTNDSHSVRMEQQPQYQQDLLKRKVSPPLPPPRPRPGLSLSSPQPNPDKTPPPPTPPTPPEPTQTQPPPEPTPTQTQPPPEPPQDNLANFKPSTGMGYGFGGPIQPSTNPEPAVAEKAKIVPSSKPAEAAAQSQSQSNNTKDNDIRDLLMQINALKKSKANEKANPELMDIAKLPVRVASGWFKDIRKDNQKGLLDSAARNDLIDKMPHIIKNNNLNFETLSRIDDAIRNNINDIIERNELNMERKKMTQNSDPLQKQDENLNDEDINKLLELTSQLVYVGEQMQKVANLSTQTANAAMNREGNLDGLKSPQGTNGMGFGANIKKKPKTEPLNPEPTDTTNQKTSMFDKGKQRLAKMGAATKEGFAKMGAATKEGFAKAGTATKEGFAKAGTATKEGFAKMKTNVSNFFTRKNKKEYNSTELTPLEPQAGGGNKTRKNRQYIREIKDNRAHLFNKEMEIINSIRNFKHGHIHEPKKQFMRAVKRG